MNLYKKDNSLLMSFQAEKASKLIFYSNHEKKSEKRYI